MVGTWDGVLVGVVAFALMEPLTAGTHRLVMHGFGWVLHHSHHQRSHRRALAGRLEANDAFPVLFAAIVCLAFAAGFNVDGWHVLVPVAVGVTAYGAAYALVHDVYIHRRLPWFAGRRVALLERLADAHRLHHRHHGGPYGMLVPWVPCEVRDRATAADLPHANGSRPDQVPVEP